MKRAQSLPIFLFFLLLIVVNCQPVQPEQKAEMTTFILIRHAEKADDGTDDPPLNEVGQQRAKALTDHLSETDITAVYSTPYKRTRRTVDAIAKQKGLEIQEYDPSGPQILNDMLEANRGGTVILSGHSNTTPMLVNKLIGEERYQQFEDSDYDNLFLVIASEVGNGTVVKITF
jgi:broad specificity phosphatase PhoE